MRNKLQSLLKHSWRTLLLMLTLITTSQGALGAQLTKGHDYRIVGDLYGGDWETSENYKLKTTDTNTYTGTFYIEGSSSNKNFKIYDATNSKYYCDQGFWFTSSNTCANTVSSSGDWDSPMQIQCVNGTNIIKIDVTLYCEYSSDSRLCITQTNQTSGFFIKHPWNDKGWCWKKLTSAGDNKYYIEDTYGDNGCNYSRYDRNASYKGWIEKNSITKYGTPSKGDKCYFEFNSSAKTITITKCSKPTTPTIGDFNYNNTCDHVYVPHSGLTNGYKFMLVRYEGASASVTSPTNGSSYSVNDHIGDGVVVVVGTTTAQSYIEIEGDKAYKFALYQYTPCYDYSDAATKVTTRRSPEVTTASPSGTSGLTSTLGGSLVSRGGGGATLEYGIEWTRSVGDKTANTKEKIGDTNIESGDFSKSFTFTSSGTYYYRAYVKSNLNISPCEYGYGAEQSVTVANCESASITTQTAAHSESVCGTEAATTALSLTGAGTEFTQTWYRSTSSTFESQEEVSTDASYTPTYPSSYGTYYYRCVVSVSCDGSTAPGNTHSVTWNENPTNGTIGGTTGAICSGVTNSVSLTRTGGSSGDGFTIQWQKTTNNGSSWDNVGSNSDSYTETAENYAIENASLRYRVITTNTTTNCSNTTVMYPASGGDPITVKAQPSAGSNPITFNNGNKVCLGSSTTATAPSDKFVPANCSVSWSSDNESVFTVGSNNGAVTTVAPGVTNIVCTISGNGCTAATKSAKVAVMPMPTTSITGDNSQCQGASVQYDVNSEAKSITDGGTTYNGTYSYSWGVSGTGWTRTSSASATPATFTVGSTTGIISVTPTLTTWDKACTGSVVNKEVSLTAAPASVTASGVYNGNESPWKDTFADGHRSAVLTEGTGTYGYYKWYLCDASGAIVTDNPTTNTNHVTFSGGDTYQCTATFDLPGTYKFLVKAGCGSATTTNSNVVTVNVPYPQMGISGPFLSGRWNATGAGTDGLMSRSGLTWTKEFICNTTECQSCSETGQFVVIQQYKGGFICGDDEGWVEFTKSGCCDNTKANKINAGDCTIIEGSITLDNGNTWVKPNNFYPAAELGVVSGDLVRLTVEMTGYNSYEVTLEKLCTPPTVQTLSNKGESTAICSGGGGVLQLSGSQTGYSYQLYNSGSIVDGAVLAGNGSALEFGITSSGVYTCKAYNTSNHLCETDMSGSVTMTISTTPKLVRSVTTKVTNYTPVTVTSISTDVYQWELKDESGTVVSTINYDPEVVGTTAYLYDRTENSVTFKGLSDGSVYTLKATTKGGCSATTTINVIDDPNLCN